MGYLCVEKGLCVGNTHFEQKGLNKNTRIARGQDRGEVKSMIVLMSGMKDTLCYL